MVIVSFLDLQVYQESFQLSLEIDSLARIFPRSERFLLSDQMIRASRAIPAIIAEGYGKRESAKEFKKYLRDALGETNEMVNHLTLAKAKKYIESQKADDLIQKYNVVGKKLSKLKDNWQKF